MKNVFGKVSGIGAAVAAIAMTILFIVKAKANRAKAAFADNKGEGFVDTAVKILIAVVIGALVLAGLYLLFNSTIMPTVTQRIQDLFDYTP
jgi:hypothetical protein